MKTSLVVIALVLSTVMNGLAQADNEAVKRVLRSETVGFFKRDKAEWANAWAHTSYINFAANLYGGDFRLIKGWNSLEKEFASQFKSIRVLRYRTITI